jgi:vitamin B12 transporter
VSDKWLVDLKLSLSDDSSDDYLDGVPKNFNYMERKAVSLLNEYVVSNSERVMLVTDYYRDSLESQYNSAPPNRENYGIAAQYMKSVDAHSLELSARYDDNQQYGSATTGALGYAFKLSTDLMATASFGTAFNAPTFSEISYSAPGDVIQPEESRTTELGLRWSRDDLTWKAAAYRTEIDNIIVYDFVCICTKNVDKAKIYGIDIDVDKQFNNSLGATVAVSLLNAKNAGSGSNSGNELERRPSATARFGIYYDVSQWRHTAVFRVAGSSYSDAANTLELDPYRVLDLMTEYSISEDVSVSGKVSNVFDSGYETVSGYSSSPRSWLLTLRYQH